MEIRVHFEQQFRFRVLNGLGHAPLIGFSQSILGTGDKMQLGMRSYKDIILLYINLLTFDDLKGSHCAFDGEPGQSLMPRGIDKTAQGCHEKRSDTSNAGV